mmetsp:Transcript_53231/g.105761  ORF Transcript_53231/g.105761 Transcript_53231/m.105761 type:complete len:208 (-) Transcript_53231:1301-1924(-)
MSCFVVSLGAILPLDGSLLNTLSGLDNSLLLLPDSLCPSMLATSIFFFISSPGHIQHCKASTIRAAPSCFSAAKRDVPRPPEHQFVLKVCSSSAFMAQYKHSKLCLAHQLLIVVSWLDPMCLLQVSVACPSMPTSSRTSGLPRVSLSEFTSPLAANSSHTESSVSGRDVSQRRMRACAVWITAAGSFCNDVSTATSASTAQSRSLAV